MQTSTEVSSGTTSLTTPGDREVRVERVFDAPRDRVWKAFTDPRLLAQWWGRGNKVDVVRHELQKGGHWRFVEHADGQEHGFEGRFREVEPMERISMTFEWDGMPGYVVIDTTEFEDIGGGRTRVITRSQFFSAEERDGMMQYGMEQGLNQSYAALDRLLARG